MKARANRVVNLYANEFDRRCRLLGDFPLDKALLEQMHVTTWDYAMYKGVGGTGTGTERTEAAIANFTSALIRNNIDWDSVPDHYQYQRPAVDWDSLPSGPEAMMEEMFASPPPSAPRRRWWRRS